VRCHERRLRASPWTGWKLGGDILGDNILGGDILGGDIFGSDIIYDSD
jgi:hypothetical protein